MKQSIYRTPKQLSLVIFVAALAFTAVHVYAQEAAAPTLLLSEVQLGTSESASQEFVEVANTTAQPMPLDGVRLEYRSKNGETWTSRHEFSGEIAPYGRVLLSNYLESRTSEFSGGLANGGGHLRLLAGGEQVIDVLDWGEGATQIVGESTPAHTPGQSLKRSVDEDGRLIDTDNSLSDWFASNDPSPHFDIWPLQDVADVEQEAQSPDDLQPEPSVDESNEQAQPAELQSASLVATAQAHQLFITELMPDPTSPLTDAEHEFVEIYNPNDTAVDLSGYLLESGSNWRYSYTIDSFVLAPGEYVAIFSQDSGLTLTNSGTSVRLSGPNGEVLDLAEYPRAKAGYSWAKVDGEWLWSSPSNGEANPPSTIEQADAAEAPTTSGSSDTEGAVLAERTVNFPAVETDASTAEDSKTAASSFVDEPEQEQPLNNWVLAGVGLIAVIYAVYEYRQDIQLRFQKLRRYLELRQQSR